MLYDGIISKPPLDDVLAHHGILGQKWGKRNGPPYPLDSKVSTGKRLKTAVQNLKRKTPAYKKDLEKYKNTIWRKLDNKRGQANSTKWANEAKNKEEKLEQEEYAKWYKEDVDRNQKYLDEFNRKYGEHKLEDLFSKKDLKFMKNEEEYADNILHPEESIRKTVLKDRNTISKQIARDMVNDFSRWEKEDPNQKNFYIKGKEVSKQQMQKYLEKEVNKQLDTINRGYNIGDYSLYTNKNGITYFTIDGIKEYSDAQPLYFNYDSKNKKILSNWGYV